jgi:hypothetical protein
MATATKRKLHSCHKMVSQCSACLKYLEPSHFEVHSATCPGAAAGPVLQCTYSTDKASSMKNHIRTHTEDAPFACGYDGTCTYTATQKVNLQEHKANKHGMDPKYTCTDGTCAGNPFYTNDSTKWKNHRNRHVGLRPYKCTEDTCTATFTQKGNRDRHVRNVHGIGTLTFACGIGNCTYKAGYRDNLTTHHRNVHNIGNLSCTICGNDTCGKLVDFRVEKAGVVKDYHGCLKCFRQMCNVKLRRETVWSDYTRNHARIGPFLEFDRSIKSLGGCIAKRPDQFSATPTVIFVGEFDEYAHGGRLYTCEMDRILKIYLDESLVAIPAMVVVRMNPDGVVELTAKQRNEAYVRLVDRLMADPPTAGIHVHYMYYRYGCDNLPEEGPYDAANSGIYVYHHDCPE